MPIVCFFTLDGWRCFVPPTFLLITLCITFLQTTFFVQNVLYFCNVIKARAMQKRTIFEKLSKVKIQQSGNRNERIS